MERTRRRTPTAQESDRTPEEINNKPVPFGDGGAFDGGGQGAEGITLISGASLTQLPFVGLALSRARTLAGAILNLDGQAPTLVNGEPVNEEYTLQIGDTLEFVHHAGEKGGYP